MKRRLIPILLFVLAALPALAQHADISFTSRVSKERLLVNSTLEYSLTLRNAQGKQLQAPPFRDFAVLQGPSRSINQTIFNGRASSYVTYTWLLQPKRTGKLKIAPATIRAANRTYRAAGRTVTVLEPGAEAANAPDYFLRAELSKSEVVVGEQLLLDLNLYSPLRPVSTNIVREPTFDGFYSRPRRQYNGSPVSVIENGKEYQRRTLGSLALFPLKEGELLIEPYRMVITAIRYGNGGSFSQRRQERIALQTDSLRVRVAELPRPRPDDFSGGVGQYTVDVQANRTKMTTDDALTLRMIISGTGDVERLKAPVPVSPEAWDVYDPVVLQEEFLDSPSGMFGRKVFEFKVVPKRAGNYTISPALTYYQTDSSRYVSDAPRTFQIAVERGSGTPNYDTDTLGPVADTLSLLPAPETVRRKRYGSSLASSPVYWGLFVLPLLLAGGFIGWDRYRRKRAGRDPAEIARARAGKLAVRELAEARGQLEAGNARSFYDAVERALRSYLKRKLRLGNVDMDDARLTGALATAGADDGLTQRYRTLLKRCEMALYAGQDGAADLKNTYGEAKSVILATEQSLS